MSKQIALLIDNSGSMFSPVVGGSSTLKIGQVSDGVDVFIQNLIAEVDPAVDLFAFSVHRFAATHEVFGGQVSSGDAGFVAALIAMQGDIPGIEVQAASQAAVGNLTDLYDAVRLTSDYLVANTPSFGAPDARYIVLFSDGKQTIAHAGSKDREGYESEQGVTFSSLLNDRNIRLRAWGIGSNTLADELRELTDQAFDPSSESEFVDSLPGSYTKVLFPESEGGVFADCTPLIGITAMDLVDDNGILPLQPVGGPPSGLLWEQFSLPFVSLTATHAAVQRVNHRDFEVLVDGCTEVLILGLFSHSRGDHTLQATSPGGAAFSPGTPGTRTTEVDTAMLFKIPDPEEGTWCVRVFGDGHQLPMILNLMARGVFKEFNFGVHSEPFQILEPGEVVITATASVGGKRVWHGLSVTAHVFGGASATLEPNDDGRFSGRVEITRPGINPIRVEMRGELKKNKSINRFEFTEALLGPATDPRFTVNPNTYQQGRTYTVELNLQDASFRHSTQVLFGSGIQTTGFEMLNATVARAHIQVASDAFVGTREVVTYNPNAESDGEVRVVEAKDGRGHTGRICCLRFDAAGKLVGVVLCDGTEICITIHDDRVQTILEAARDRNLSVTVYVDAKGCLTEIEVCRS